MLHQNFHLKAFKMIFIFIFFGFLLDGFFSSMGYAMDSSEEKTIEIKGLKRQRNVPLEEDDRALKQQMMHIGEALFFLIEKNKDLASMSKFRELKNKYESFILTPNAMKLGVTPRVTQFDFDDGTASFTGKQMKFLVEWTKSATKVKEKADREGEHEEFWDNEWECSPILFQIINDLMEMIEMKLTIFVNIGNVRVSLKELAGKEEISIA